VHPDIPVDIEQSHKKSPAPQGFALKTQGLAFLNPDGLTKIT
jgi:hypothetical protein